MKSVPVMSEIGESILDWRTRELQHILLLLYPSRLDVLVWCPDLNNGKDWVDTNL